MIQEFFERTEVFSSINADPKYKKFTYNGVTMDSVTAITKSVEPPFDDVAKAAEISAKTGRPADEILAEWKLTGTISCLKGDAVHEFIEALMNNKFARYPVEAVKAKFGDEADPVRVKYDAIIRQVRLFREQIRGKLIPVRSEMVIGSPTYMVCGIVDQLFWNVKAQAFQIWDWKTNSKFETDSKYHLLDPVAHLSNSKLDIYSLQLSMYKKMFVEMTGIPLGDCYLCWFSEDQATHNIFRAKDLSNEAEILMRRSMEARGLTTPGSVF